jgi:hypothetical protein
VVEARTPRRECGGVKTKHHRTGGSVLEVEGRHSEVGGTEGHP